MAAPTITLRGQEYDLSTSLRVAYKIQGQHNHKSYSKVFEEVGDMKLEDQVNIIYAAFQVSNPGSDMDKKAFLEAVLDEYGLATIMELISEIIEGIMFRGMTEEKIALHKEKQEAAVKKMRAQS